MGQMVLKTSYSTETGRQSMDAKPVETGWRSFEIEQGERVAFRLVPDEKNAIYLVSEEQRRVYRLEVNESKEIQIGGQRFRFSLEKDIVRADNKFFLLFLVYSFFAHLLFFAVAPFIPESPPPVLKINQDQVQKDRILKFVQKLKAKKERRLVKLPPKPKPKPKVVKVVKKTPRKIKKPRRIVKKPKPRKKIVRRAVKRKPQQLRNVKAKQAKQMKARAAKALSFLSSSKNKLTVSKTNYRTRNAKYTRLPKGVTAVSTGRSKFSIQIADMPDGIQTKGLRTMGKNTSYSGYGGGRSAEFTTISGRVDSGDVHSGGGGDGLIEGIVAPGGVLTSGRGKIPPSVLEAILRKYLNRFQYCYEKVLLSNGRLAGRVMMSWKIATSGVVTNVKALKSELNSRQLHSCLSEEIGNIRFPQPTGGWVQVKYPFKFSNKTL